jgi:hypothetical protein
MYGGYNNRGRGRGRGGTNYSQWPQQFAHRQPPREGDEKIPLGQWPGKRAPDERLLDKKSDEE